MLKIIASDGAIFEGKNAAQVVRAMKDASWNAPEQKMTYMEEVVDRVGEMTGVRFELPAFSYRALTPGLFLMYLVKTQAVSLAAQEQGSLFSAEEQFAEEMKKEKDVHYFD